MDHAGRNIWIQIPQGKHIDQDIFWIQVWPAPVGAIVVKAVWLGPFQLTLRPLLTHRTNQNPFSDLLPEEIGMWR